MPNSLPERIYKAAVALDHHTLRDLALRTSLDEWYPGEFYTSAITKLACTQHPNKKAIELLLRYGANLDYAVYGAAQGENWALMEELLARGASIDMAAQGASLAKSNAWREKLEDQGARLENLFQGAVLAGDREYVFKKLANNTEKLWSYLVIECVTGKVTLQREAEHKGYPINFLVEGVISHYAFSCQNDVKRLQSYINRLIKLRQRNFNQTELTVTPTIYENILFGTAMSGGFQAVMHFFNDYKNKIKRAPIELAKIIVTGFLIGGHGAMASDFLQMTNAKGLPTSPNDITDGALLGRHYTLIENWGVIAHRGSMLEGCDFLTSLLFFNTGEIEIPPLRLTRFKTLSQELKYTGLSLSQVLVKRDPNFFNELLLLVYITLFKNSALLPPEIWLHILSFSCIVPLTTPELEKLGAVLVALTLINGLYSYHSLRLSSEHRNSAIKLHQDLELTLRQSPSQSCQELLKKLALLLQTESETLDQRPKTRDPYPGLIHKWGKRLQGNSSGVEAPKPTFRLNAKFNGDNASFNLNYACDRCTIV